jgi:choline dehydrogenase-like flavoprotein
VGLDYYDLTATRARALGGGSRLWPGWCRPLDPIDFTGRPWVPDTGWPISFEQMLPFYREAASVCQLATTEWDDDDVDTTRLPALYRPPFVGGDIETAIWHGSPPTRFGTEYRRQLTEAPTVTVLLHSTAVQIACNRQTRAATGVQIATLGGNRFSVTARATVLAAGALETTRLLLASQGRTDAGLGNEHGLVGRYFMEHPHLVTAKVALFPRPATNRSELPAIDRGITGARARLNLQRPAGRMKIAYTIGAARQQAEQLLNFSTHFQTVGPVDRGESDAYEAFKLVVGNLRAPRELAGQLFTGSMPDGTGRVIRRLIRGTPEIISLIVNEALRRPRELALYSQTEQAPNPDSRVTIDPLHRDELGLPRIRVDWRLSRIDKESIIKAHRILGEHLERVGLGRLVPEPAFRTDSPDWGPNLRGGHHHLGTARAAIDPRHGVVDADGQVHTVPDLYISDSAVFPSGGYANPLLTIIAWTLRLADTIGRRYS